MKEEYFQNVIKKNNFHWNDLTIKKKSDKNEKHDNKRKGSDKVK